MRLFLTLRKTCKITLIKALKVVSFVAAPLITYAQNLTASIDNKPTVPKTEVVKANKVDVTNPVNPKKSEPIVLVGDVGTAQDVSYMPDRRYVGVYMVVDKDYPHSPEFLIERLKTYFDGYSLPAKFIKQENPAEGKGFSMRMYVGGQSYVGDMTNGNVTMPEIKTNHAKVFSTLQTMYSKMNPELNLAFTPGQN